VITRSTTTPTSLQAPHRCCPSLVVLHSWTQREHSTGDSNHQPVLPDHAAATTGPAATTGINTSAKTTVGALLLGNPEYTSVTYGLDPIESGNFNSFLFKISKRMSDGLNFELNYVHSRNLGATMFENPGAPCGMGRLPRISQITPPLLPSIYFRWQGASILQQVPPGR